VDFYPTALEKGVRSEQALMLALAEMHVQGLSARKVTKTVEELCSHSVNSSQVSACTAKLDDGPDGKCSILGVSVALRDSPSSPFLPPTIAACAPATPANASIRKSNAEPASPPYFPTNLLSCGLVCALLSEISNERLSGKIYLNMNPAGMPRNSLATFTGKKRPPTLRWEAFVRRL